MAKISDSHDETESVFVEKTTKQDKKDKSSLTPLEYAKEIAKCLLPCFVVYLLGYFRWSLLFVIIPIVGYVIHLYRKKERKRKVIKKCNIVK